MKTDRGKRNIYLNEMEILLTGRYKYKVTVE